MSTFFFLIFLFILAGMMNLMTIADIKAIHARKKAERREKWSTDPKSGIVGMILQMKRKTINQGYIISMRPLKTIKHKAVEMSSSVRV